MDITSLKISSMTGIKALEAEGLLNERENKLRLTRKGILVLLGGG